MLLDYAMMIILTNQRLIIPPGYKMSLLYKLILAILVIYSLYPECWSCSYDEDHIRTRANTSTGFCRGFKKNRRMKTKVMEYDKINTIPIHSISTAVLTIQRLAWKRLVVISDDKWRTYADYIAETLYEKGVQLIRFTLNTSDTAYGISKKAGYLKERNRLNILLMSQTNSVKELFQLVNTWGSTCFFQNTHWLVVSQDERLDDRIPLSCCTHNVLIVQQYSVRQCPLLREIVRPWVVQVITGKLSGQTRGLEIVQEWQTEGGFPSSTNDIASVEELYPNGEIGLDNITLRVGVVPWPSFMTKHYLDNGTVFSGIVIDYLKELSRLLNFRYDLVEPPDGEFGRTVNDTWTGAIGMLLRKEIDMIGFPLSYESRRQEVVDFVFPLLYESYHVHFRPLNESEARWSLLSRTFTWFSACIIIGLLFALMLFAAVETLQQRRLQPTYQADFRFGDWWMSLTGILLRQGDVVIPQMTTSKLLWALWSYGCLILAAVIGANLMASLAVSHTRPPFTSLKGLLQNDEYDLGYPSGGFAELLLKTSSGETYRQLWDKIQRSADHRGRSSYDEETPQSRSTFEFHDHVNKMLREKYAFISNQLSLLGRCNISYLPESLGVVPASFAFLKGSPYTEMFSRVTRRLHNTGIIDHMNKKKLRQMPKCSRATKPVRKLAMSDLKPVFYILISLVFVTLITFIAEIVPFRIMLVRIFSPPLQ